MLPFIFVDKAGRLQKIIAIVSEAVKQCLKKKGMHIPPWRKAEYIKAKWLSPFSRIAITGTLKEVNPEDKNSVEDGELGEPSPIFGLSESSEEWKPPEKNPRSSKVGVKMVTGLASAIEDEIKQ
ncbi:hypothetical protein HRI_000032000 [Hibiscus trionum]|uniref:Uncharacterized protein n=1 Tax=Hibiscus trionum TaxID=183268 RepID=A0A9W7GRA0_HIBTR|nr:hypothetical protein HRI_000032000 [Hibiscus trionum]